MSEASSHRLNSVWLSLGAAALQYAASLCFFVAGTAALLGEPGMVATFERMGIGSSLRVIIGVIEILGAVLVVLPASAFWGATLLTYVATGAVLLPVVIEGEFPIRATAVLVVCGAIAWVKTPDM